MKEVDYIAVTERAQVAAAIEILRGITPQNSSVIALTEHQEVMKQLKAWQEKLYERIEIVD